MSVRLGFEGGEGGITMFMNRVLRKISGSKRDEIMGEWCILLASLLFR
jgi:hypothetical protein